MLSSVNAVIAIEIGKTAAPHVGEAHLIDIIASAEDGHLVTIIEIIDIKIALIAMISAISTGESTEPTIVHILLDSKIDHGFILAIIDTCEASSLTLTIDHLHLLYHIRREILGSQLRVIGEELLAIHQDLGDSLATRSNRAIRTDLHAGKFLEKIFDRGIGIGVERPGIKLQGVLLGDHGSANAGHHRLLKQHRTCGHTESADIDSIGVALDLYRFGGRIHTGHR